MRKSIEVDLALVGTYDGLINDLDLIIVREAIHGMNSPGLGARDILHGNAAISVPTGRTVQIMEDIPIDALQQVPPAGLLHRCHHRGRIEPSSRAKRHGIDSRHGGRFVGRCAAWRDGHDYEHGNRRDAYVDH